MPRRVVPVLGFSWGFDIDGSGPITPRPIGELGAAEWRSHLSQLRGRYPLWQFGGWPR